MAGMAAVVLAAGMLTADDVSVVEESLDRHFASKAGDRVCLVCEDAGAQSPPLPTPSGAPFSAA
jgi:hypothetical protein